VSDFPPLPKGTIFSLSRAQTTRIELAEPEPDEIYALEVAGRSFEHVRSTDQGRPECAQALAARINHDQTVIVARAIDGALVLTGPLATTFDVETSANMVAQLAQPAIGAMTPDGSRPLGPLVVVVDQNAPGIPPRHFWTRIYDGMQPIVREVWRVLARELDSGLVIDIDVADVQTVLAR
jgi:hypothetical protein